MELDPHLTLAARMIAAHDTFRAHFAMGAGEMPVPAFVQAVSDLVDEAQHYTGLKSRNVHMDVHSRSFSVEGSPILVRMVVDCAPDWVKSASLSPRV